MATGYLLETFPNQMAANDTLHMYAEMLRKADLADRWGVRVSCVRGAWGVILHDREPEKGPPDAFEKALIKSTFEGKA